jgi:hypothetical protein
MIAFTADVTVNNIGLRQSSDLLSHLGASRFATL